MVFPDLEAVLGIEQVSFVQPWTRGAFVQELIKSYAVLRVAEIGSRIAGYVIAWLIEDELHIANVAVHPEFRRRGIAERLILTVLAEDPRIRWAGLEVRRGNAAARAMYRKLGFEETGVRERYYTTEGEDAILMTLYVDAGESGNNDTL